MRSKKEEIEEAVVVDDLGKPVVDKINLAVFNAVKKFRSVRRAMRRGHVTKWGEIIPRRPFNNSKRTEGRELQKKKEKIYEQLKHRQQVLAKQSSEGRI